MKVLKKYNQIRRDCWADLECEGCGHKHTYKSAYDDRYFWDNVIPATKCEECGESTNSLGLEKGTMPTKYPEGMQV